MITANPTFRLLIERKAKNKTQFRRKQSQEMDYGSNENRFNSSNRSYGNREGGDGGGGGGGGYRSNFSASERSVIQIPGTHIGKIIGPAGRHINDLQRQYNVRIQINKMVSIWRFEGAENDFKTIPFLGQQRRNKRR